MKKSYSLIIGLLFVGALMVAKNEMYDAWTQTYNKWIGYTGTPSVSGPGSDLIQTQKIRNELPSLFKKFNIKAILDAPCGDFYWMRHVDKSYLDCYIGVDIVDQIVNKNNNFFGNEKVKFIQADLTKDALPQVDLVLCRDCLVHLQFQKIFSVIRQLKKSKSRYLLTTTFVGRNSNEDFSYIIGWRTLNFQKPPFNFPEPILVINEGCTEQDGRYADKSLGLWAIEDLPDF